MRLGRVVTPLLLTLLLYAQMLARGTVRDSEYLDAAGLEEMTGTAASTWRYWAHIGLAATVIQVGQTPGVEKVNRSAESLQSLADEATAE